MSTYLLDANVLIALVVPDHEHHSVVVDWFSALGRRDSFSTTPITEGALVRYLIRMGHQKVTIVHALEAIHRHERHVFWADDVPYHKVDLTSVQGHRQVTDTYISALAQAKEGHMVTLNKGFAQRFDHTLVHLLVP